MVLRGEGEGGMQQRFSCDVEGERYPLLKEGIRVL